MLEVLDILKKEIRENDLKCLNRILTSDVLSKEDKKNAFDIAIYLVKGFNDPGMIKEESTLTKFTDFCLNEDESHRVVISELLNDINYEVEKLINCNNFDSLCNLFKWKLSTIISVSQNITDLSMIDYYDVLKKIFNSRLYLDNYIFIERLFANEVLKNKDYHEKRMIAFDVALTKEVKDITGVNDLSRLEDYLWSVLTNRDLLSFDNDIYRKAVLLGVDYVPAYVLDNVLNNQELTVMKKASVVDYYYHMIEVENHMSMPNLNWMKNIEQESEREIFSIVYCDRLVSMDDQLYASELENIKSCNKPFSYIEILKNEEIDDARRNIALDIVKTGDVEKDTYHKFRFQTSDYKSSVALVAVSPLMLGLSLDEYKKMLTLVNCYCEKMESLYHESDRRKEWLLQSSKTRGITKILNNANLVKSKLWLAIDEVTSYNDDGLVQEVADFCSHTNSQYYTDEEYKKIIELIKTNRNKAKFRMLTYLFTNCNVPFMEDKSLLFDVALNEESVSAIEKLKRELNECGHYNKNMSIIMNDVDEGIFKELEETSLVRKLIK